jgi:hypothetical protein
MRFVDWELNDTKGTLAYEFQCSGYNVPGLGKIDRYGLSCGLFMTSSPINLLQDAIDPYSRMNMAEVLPQQLKDACALYPDWGATRVFRLRGFALTLRFSNPIFASSDFQWGALKQVDLSLSVIPDDWATEPVAPAPKYAYWGFLPNPHACAMSPLPIEH